jgi:glycogen debranching enzyme
VYGAKTAAARLAGLLGLTERAHELENQAQLLQQRFEEAFWCEDLSTYALALDGKKQPCRVRASNAGHCLLTGITGAQRARRVAATLMAEPSFTGWGIRTVASTEARYNPMSYHNGSVWPHDNAVISAGFGRYGMREHAAKILSGLLDSSVYFDLHRLPELFCGFTRRHEERPTLYPTSCSPQAWAAAAPLLCLQSCLGIEVYGADGRVVFRHPFLPQFLGQINIKGLRVGGSSIDFSVTRYEKDVGVRLIRKVGDIEFIVLM